MDTAIEFKHVKKVYGEKVIIDDFNLKITPGEIFNCSWQFRVWKNHYSKNDQWFNNS